MAVAAAIKARAFSQKKPALRMMSSIASGLAPAADAGFGKAANRRGVIRLTRSSVHCAERMTAARHCQGVAKSSVMQASG